MPWCDYALVVTYENGNTLIDRQALDRRLSIREAVEVGERYVATRGLQTAHIDLWRRANGAERIVATWQRGQLQPLRHGNLKHGRRAKHGKASRTSGT